MASDWDFTYAVARIRVLETHLLSDADVGAMVAAKDEDAVLTYLRDKGWGDASGTKDAEEILKIEDEKTWATMRELRVDNSVFDVSYGMLNYTGESMLGYGLTVSCSLDSRT